MHSGKREPVKVACVVRTFDQILDIKTENVPAGDDLRILVSNDL